MTTLISDSQTSRPPADLFLAGDESCWRALVADHGARLHRMSVRVVGDAAEAESLVQECFLRAFRARARLRDMEKLGSWLTAICMRLCFAYRRRPGAGPAVDALEAFLPASEAERPDRLHASRDELAKVLAALDDLTRRQRTCLTLAVFEGMSGRGIAEALEISEGAVKRYIHEARTVLARSLDDLDSGKERRHGTA